MIGLISVCMLTVW